MRDGPEPGRILFVLEREDGRLALEIVDTDQNRVSDTRRGGLLFKHRKTRQRILPELEDTVAGPYLLLLLPLLAV